LYSWVNSDHSSQSSAWTGLNRLYDGDYHSIGAVASNIAARDSGSVKFDYAAGSSQQDVGSWRATISGLSGSRAFCYTLPAVGTGLRSQGWTIIRDLARPLVVRLFSAPAEKTYNGEGQIVGNAAQYNLPSGINSLGGKGEPTISYTTNGSVWQEQLPTFTNADTYIVTARAVQANFATGYAVRALTISPRAISQVFWSATDTAVFNTNPWSPRATAAGVLGRTVHLTIEGGNQVNANDNYRATVTGISSVDNDRTANYTLPALRENLRGGWTYWRIKGAAGLDVDWADLGATYSGAYYSLPAVVRLGGIETDAALAGIEVKYATGAAMPGPGEEARWQAAKPQFKRAGSYSVYVRVSKAAAYGEPVSKAATLTIKPY
jgi:hypothetical protein